MKTPDKAIKPSLRTLFCDNDRLIALLLSKQTDKQMWNTDLRQVSTVRWKRAWQCRELAVRNNSQMEAINKNW